MLTTIQISGLQIFGYHGLFEEERRLGQKFNFDIDATLNAVRHTGTTTCMLRSATMPWWTQP